MANLVTESNSGTSQYDTVAGAALAANTAEAMETMAAGHRLILYATLAFFSALFFAMLVYARNLPVPDSIANIAVVVGIVAASIMALFGVFRVAIGMGYALWVRILLTILLFLPPINIFIILLRFDRAIKALRRAGYRIGFLGASKSA